MKNPLVLFVGAAVAAVGVLAGATADRWHDWPTALQTTATTPEAVADAAPESAPESAPEPKAPAPKAETARPEESVGEDETPEVAGTPAEDPASAGAGPERLAAVDPQAHRAETQIATPVEPAAPRREPAAPGLEPGTPGLDDAATAPRFDVVRLDEGGSLIVAGRAAPEAEMALFLDDQAIATDTANTAGEWLIMPHDPLPPGTHQLRVEARGPAASQTQSSRAIALAVPDRAGERAPLAASEPGPAPLVEDDSAEEDVAEAAPSEPIPEAVPEAAPEPAEPAGEEQVALAPLPEPDTGAPQADIPEVDTDAPAQRQVEPPVDAAPDEQAAIDPDPELLAEPPAAAADEVPEPLDSPLALEGIDYDDDGDIVFTGRAGPGRTIRIYVDNRLVGEATVGDDGRWAFAGDHQISPGRHVLRADLTGATGEVFGRIILPFVRAAGREVAALVDGRRRAAAAEERAKAAQGIEAPEPGAPDAPEAPDAFEDAEPEAPAVAEDVAPEPQPEAPVVAEDVAPEPEPEAPVVVEDVAPEPEPEAPAVAEDVAPEPEPEAPVVAEDVAPEPEPEAPAVAEDVAPEPEPEAPAVAEDVAPEPEPQPEGLAVAEDVAPEPEPQPEGLAVAEDVAPDTQPEAPAVAQDIPPESDGATQGVAPGLQSAEPVPPAGRSRVAGLDGGPVSPEAPDARPIQPGYVVIQPGNNLWRISRVIYGRGVEYTAIYRANRDKIRDPDLIYPGQILTTPGVNPPKEIDPDRRQPLSPEELARRNAVE